MTERQREQVRKKMIALEKDILNFFRKHSYADPDGSFAMCAFHKGYDSGLRAAKKAGRR